MSFKKLSEELRLPPIITEWAIYLDTTHGLLEIIYPDLTKDELIAVGDRVVNYFMGQGIYPSDGVEAAKLLFSEVINRLGWPETFKPYTKEADVSKEATDTEGDGEPV